MNINKFYSKSIAVCGFSLLIGNAVQAGSLVHDTVTQISPTSWKYEFTISNLDVWGDPYSVDQFTIVGFNLPYFSDAGITDIHTPDNVYWAWSIIDDDSFGLGHGAKTLHWGSGGSIHPGGSFPDYYFGGDGSNTISFPGQTLGGFSFVANFSPVSAPVIWDMYGGGTLIGDPALPGSPDAIASGLSDPLPVVSIPEPDTYAMLLAGLGLLVFTIRSRKISGFV